MMDLLQLFRRNSSYTTSIISRSCDIEFDNNRAPVGTTAALAFPASPSLIFMTTSLYWFSLTNPDETLV